LQLLENYSGLSKYKIKSGINNQHIQIESNRYTLQEEEFLRMFLERINEKELRLIALYFFAEKQKKLQGDSEIIKTCVDIINKAYTRCTNRYFSDTFMYRLLFYGCYE